MLIRAKKIFLLKNSIWVSKNEKMNPKKVISKNMTEIFACNFFLVHFLQLFQRIRNQREIQRFLISFFIFCLEKIFWG